MIAAWSSKKRLPTKHKEKPNAHITLLSEKERGRDKVAGLIAALWYVQNHSFKDLLKQFLKKARKIRNYT